MNDKRGFLLGIGSNIAPESNVLSIIELLLEHFPTLHLSRVLRIPPVGMNTHKEFLNVVLFIETDMAESDLKAICNNIELQLGRDRTDPDRKMKDRCADLDILAAIALPSEQQRTPSQITDEYFLYPLIEELIAYLIKQPISLAQAGIKFEVNGLSFGEAATAINRDTRTRHKRVV